MQRFFDRLIVQVESHYDFGKPLKGVLKGLWRYRVGDYRIICEIQDDTLIILALSIGYRSRIYR